MRFFKLIENYFAREILMINYRFLFFTAKQRYDTRCCTWKNVGTSSRILPPRWNPTPCRRKPEPDRSSRASTGTIPCAFWIAKSLSDHGRVELIAHPICNTKCVLLQFQSDVIGLKLKTFERSRRIFCRRNVFILSQLSHDFLLFFSQKSLCRTQPQSHKLHRLEWKESAKFGDEARIPTDAFMRLTLPPQMRVVIEDPRMSLPVIQVAVWGNHDYTQLSDDVISDEQKL